MSAEKFSEIIVDRAIERARIYGLCDALKDASSMGIEEDVAEFEKDLVDLLEGRDKDEIISLFVGYIENDQP
jgi:hypothetical protein